MNYKIKDNFLNKADFNALKKIVLSNELAWYWEKDINTEPGYDKNSNQSYFVHNLFNAQLDYVYSYYYKNFTVFWKKLGIKSLMRAKINLYVKTHKIEEHYPHVDFPFEHKGCLFSFNTCDGYIKLEDGTKIESVANRALLFEPNKPHSSTSTTNAKGRFNLNLNYF